MIENEREEGEPERHHRMLAQHVRSIQVQENITDHQLRKAIRIMRQRQIKRKLKLEHRISSYVIIH